MTRAWCLGLVAACSPLTSAFVGPLAAHMVNARPASVHYAEAPPAAAAAEQFTDQLGQIDPEQAAMMEELCIVVDRDDKPLAPATKVQAHLCSEGLALHRAFSVFLFDSSGRMLLQRRALSKHTFPGYWTNACCSHPLWNDFEMGLDGDGGSSSALEAAARGARRAAARKLEQELGVPSGQLPESALRLMTRIHYRAESEDGVWGEHEVDYIFLAQADVDVAPNANEVAEAAYVTRAELRALLARADAGDARFTPWSRHVIDAFAHAWWDALGDTAALDALADEVIHRVGDCA
eukprot:TRINITY_DN2989_c1_g1_i1.p2 TRINITY_DN2989_c1_g1~~TRINITY_DN2989_c1_g1_i1.p2  ORF type:complete len:293 (+),score=114.86 TRINITY_DN2989_c1_g1_i1:198-1076(+)